LTVVTLRAWTVREGLDGWLQKLLTWRRETGARNLSLWKRLAYLQFEAERRVS
jgi:hypothetical protein